MPYSLDVFIAYYNDLQYLPACIDSILWQKNVEVVVHLVNDCSHEDDKFLLERYGNHKNIFWYRTTHNVGPYKIWNALFSYMKTGHFALMGSDDISLPSHFTMAMEALRAEQTDVFFAAMENFLSPDRPANSDDVEFVNSRPFYQSAIDGVLVNGTMVISKAAFEKVNGFENVFCGGDSEFSERLKRSGLKMSISRSCVSLRRIHGKNLSSKNGPFGLNSPIRKQIAEQWKTRFKEWKTHFDISRYGGLKSVGNILIPVTHAEKQNLIAASRPPQDRTQNLRSSNSNSNHQTIVQSKTSKKKFPAHVLVADNVFVDESCTFLEQHRQNGSMRQKPTRIMSGANIGEDSVIFPGVTIGANCDIRAGSIVNRNVADYSRGGGTPYQEESRVTVTVGIATYPPRLTALPDTIESLHDQVDCIHVCLNEYRQVPAVLQRYSKVICTIPERNLSDLGKFLQLPKSNGYFLTCDDDLLYPHDYVTKTITQLRKHGGVVSYLGRVFPRDRKCQSYYRDTAEYYHCLREVQQDHQVHVVGTGVMCFHTDSVDFNFGDFQQLGMADVQFGVYAALNRIKLTALKHPKDWIVHTNKIDLKETIYSKNKDNDRKYTDIINQVDWNTVEINSGTMVSAIP